MANKGYHADQFRDALADKAIKSCIPGRRSRSILIKHDRRRYKRRHKIKDMFGRLKDRRRIAMRYDCCPTVFLSAIALTTVMSWVWVLSLASLQARTTPLYGRSWTRRSTCSCASTASVRSASGSS